MKCELVHARCLKVTGLPVAGLSDLAELTFTIRYVEEENDGHRLDKAITLDNVVIPAILRALNTKSN